MVAPTLDQLDELVGNKELFSALVPLKGRKWFVSRLNAHVMQGAPHDVLTKIKEYLQRAQTIAQTRRDPPLDYWPPSVPISIADEIIVRLMYGAFGVHPETFLDRSNPDLLHFIIERRMRSIIQMAYHVNSKEPIYFEYPSGALETMKIRSTARSFWKGIYMGIKDGVEVDVYPFIPRDGVSPHEAVSRLFTTAGGDLDDVNVVDCQTAAFMVLLDSLQTAAKPEKLFAALADQGEEYLCIDDLA